jgi:hypothetical protein
MRHPLLCAALLSGSLWAGPLRFSPDTICAGTGTGCAYSTVVKNISPNGVVVRLVSELSPIPVVNMVMFSGTRYAIFDSIRPSSPGYLLTPKYSAASIALPANDSATLQRCTVGSQYLIVGAPSHRKLAQRDYAARSSASIQLGNGELIHLVFSTEAGDTDTLHVKVNQWYAGTAIHPRTKARNPSLPNFTADGKTTLPHSNGVEIGPDGAHPVLH